MDLTTQKHIFGFDKGYIWLVENSIHLADDEELNKSSARFCQRWGWYFTGAPATLSDRYKLKKLIWEEVGNEDGSLKDVYIYPENNVGKVGERIELDVVITSVVEYETRWKTQYEYDMLDARGCMFRWITSAKSWKKDSSHHIRGTIKEFDKGVCILTRCMEK